MFRRRQERPLSGKLRELLWPSMGLRRAWRYSVARLKRVGRNPHRLAAGLASGIAVAMTPFLGLHVIMGAILALAVRGNLIAMAIGTVLANPWTIPAIILWDYEVGKWALGHEDHVPLPAFSWRGMLDHPTEILLPLSLGGVITAVPAWLIVYAVTRFLFRRKGASSQTAG